MRSRPKRQAFGRDKSAGEGRPETGKVQDEKQGAVGGDQAVVVSDHRTDQTVGHKMQVSS